MKQNTFLLLIALLAPLALKAQTSTPGTPDAQSSAPSAQSVQGRNERSLDDNPAFKSLSPEQQEWVRSMAQRLDKAVAEKDSAAIDQLAKETAEHMNGLDNPAPALTYHYPNTPANNPPAPNAQPAKPQAASPCTVPPKKPGFFGMLKKHAEQTLQKQTGKADAQIAKGTGGNVDAGVQDATTTAVNQANQPNPCTPAKGQPAKQ